MCTCPLLGVCVHVCMPGCGDDDDDDDDDDESPAQEECVVCLNAFTDEYFHTLECHRVCTGCFDERCATCNESGVPATCPVCREPIAQGQYQSEEERTSADNDEDALSQCDSGADDGDASDVDEKGNLEGMIASDDEHGVCDGSDEYEDDGEDADGDDEYDAKADAEDREIA